MRSATGQLLNVHHSVSEGSSVLVMPDSNFSNTQFLERLKKGDPYAWEEIVNAYLPQLLRAGRGMGFSSDESQDLAQSVFVSLMEGIGRFEGRSHIRTFLFGIFYNKVAEHLREIKKESVNDPIDDIMEAHFEKDGAWREPPIGIEREILSAEIGRAISKELETLPRAQRIAFYLREIEELEASEICKRMRITPTYLGVLLFRARNRLREVLGNQGFHQGKRELAEWQARERVYVHSL